MQEYTIGKLYIDGQWFSDTLEDRDRGLTMDMSIEQIRQKKIYGNTAIPTGTYTIDMNTISPKFKDRSWAKSYEGKIPRLKNVPGYDGVLIHPGNTSKDTSGCILVGKNTVKGMVTSSQDTFRALMDMLTKAEEPIIITIE